MHGQYLDDFNRNYALEPPELLNWSFRFKSNAEPGLWYTIKMQPLPVFFFEQEVSSGVFERTNKDLDFQRQPPFCAGLRLADEPGLARQA